MINRKNPTGESGFFNPIVLTITAMALCLVLAIRATAALTSAAPTLDTWTTEPYGGNSYFPVREFEVMPDMFE